MPNPYCSFWIYDKNEFFNFTKSKFWRFDWRYETISGEKLIREINAIGYHHPLMKRYKATIVPEKKNKILNDCFINHLSNKYANAPAGLFGTFEVNSLVNKRTFFFKYNIINIYMYNLKILIYKFLRINFKSFKYKVLKYLSNN